MLKCTDFQEAHNSTLWTKIFHHQVYISIDLSVFSIQTCRKSRGKVPLICCLCPKGYVWYKQTACRLVCTISQLANSLQRGKMLVVPECLETFVHLKVFHFTPYKQRVWSKLHDLQSQKFCDFEMYRKSESKTKFRKKGYLMSIKTGISAFQTHKEKSTIIKQQNAHTICHLHIDNFLKQ